jgi:hypothetical protein
VRRGGRGLPPAARPPQGLPQVAVVSVPFE